MSTNNRPSAREVRDLVLSDRCAARGAWGVLNDMRERLRTEAEVRGYDDPWLDAEWRGGETGNTNFDRMVQHALRQLREERLVESRDWAECEPQSGGIPYAEYRATAKALAAAPKPRSLSAILAEATERAEALEREAKRASN